MSTRRQEPDFDGEQEVDLGRYWRALAARWWLPLAGLVAGALIGYASTLGGNDVYSAAALVYPGQPYSANSTIQIQSPATNPSTIRAIVASRSVLDQAAHASGL